MIERNSIWISPSGIEFEVIFPAARHAQDCSQSMVVYANLTDTKDSEAGTVWTLDESLFLKFMREKE